MLRRISCLGPYSLCLELTFVFTTIKSYELPQSISPEAVLNSLRKSFIWWGSYNKINAATIEFGQNIDTIPNEYFILKLIRLLDHFILLRYQLSDVLNSIITGFENVGATLEIQFNCLTCLTLKRLRQMRQLRQIKPSTNPASMPAFFRCLLLLFWRRGAGRLSGRSQVSG